MVETCSVTLFVTVALLIVLKIIQIPIVAYDTSTGPYQTADGHWSAHSIAGPIAAEDDQACVSLEQEQERLRLRPAQPSRPTSLPTGPQGRHDVGAAHPAGTGGIWIVQQTRRQTQTASQGGRFNDLPKAAVSQRKDPSETNILARTSQRIAFSIDCRLERTENRPGHLRALRFLFGGVASQQPAHRRNPTTSVSNLSYF